MRKPVLSARLVVERLRVFRRMLFAPLAVKALIQSNWGSKWRDEVLRSLAALRSTLGSKLASAPDPYMQPRFWESSAADNKAAWRGLLQKFLAITGEDPVAWRATRELFWETVEADSSDDEIMCSCGAVFRGQAALDSHRARAHGYRHHLRTFVPTSVCAACGCDFRSRLRCLAHVQRGSVACRLRFEAGEFQAASAAQLEWADAEEQQWRVECRRSGRSVLSGPPRLPKEVVDAVA